MVKKLFNGNGFGTGCNGHYVSVGSSSPYSAVVLNYFYHDSVTETLTKSPPARGQLLSDGEIENRKLHLQKKMTNLLFSGIN